MASFRVKINTKVLEWVRDVSGYQIEELESKFKPYRLWERGQVQPTYNQLKDLANFFKRPVPLFFFKSPPKKSIPQADYRKLPEDYQKKIAPKTLIQIRTAANKAKYFREISETLGIERSELKLSAKITDNPEELAGNIRAELKIKQSDVQLIDTAGSALRFWRELVEQSGVLTFAISVALEEIRGGALIIDNQPLILFSTKDSIRGRIFTVFHEFAHLLLQKNSDHYWGEKIEGQINPEIETFCNRFSAEFVLPESEVLKECPQTVTYEWLKRFARKNHVSSFVALYRLKNLDRISEEVVVDYKRRLQKEIDEHLRKQKLRQQQSSSGPSPYVLQAHNNSPIFLKHVFRALDRQFLSTIEASRILNTTNITKLRYRAGI